MFLLFKSMLVKIKKSLGRFSSILIIIALGMGFFAGIRSSSPSMLSTIENYYDSNNYMDVKIISTFGLTDDDISALAVIDDNIKVIPTYSLDVLENGKSIRVHALEDSINNVSLIEGRMPNNDLECVADSTYYHIGDKITLERNDLDDYLINKTYTVVGTINSVLYITNDKGISNIGNGKLTSFIFINRDNFIIDYYTEGYIQMTDAILDDAQGIDYQSKYDDLYNKLLQLKPIREAIRYEEILKKASDEINEIENDLYKNINKAKKDLASTKKVLDNNRNKINNGIKEIKDNISILDQELSKQNLNYYTIDISINSLNSTINSLKEELNNIDNNTDEYKYKEEYLNNLSNQLITLNNIKDNYNTLNNKLEELNKQDLKLDDAYLEYNKGLNELTNEENKAKDKINDAYKELETIEKPMWYIQNRTNNYGYTNFKDDASVVASIAKIFPLFFILIVALIILNTITRMIEEERTEIGTLKSLGYSNFYIILMYILYSFIAAFIGTFIGLLGGYLIIPKLIFNIYKVTYILPVLNIKIDLISFIFMIIIGVILIVGITIYGCLRELKDVPATLLRPKPPKDGKKVFLEHIRIIWNKLSFIWKITIRNLFRYKKRIIMTVVGVAGSMALLIAGYGLRDSISDLANIQYNDIIKYDFLTVLDDNYSSLNEDIIKVFDKYSINDYITINEESYTFIDQDKRTNDVYLIATSINDLNNYISLKDINSNNIIEVPDYGAIITSKMAKLLNVNINDNIDIRNSNNELIILNVKGIVENYTLNYIYMSNNYYEIVFNKPYMINSIIGNTNVDHNLLSNDLISLDDINAINYNSDNIKEFDTMIKGLNDIVYLIIVCASLLALVILYNLTIININERKREIATLKVLGFKDKEVGSYVHRETLILTISGVIVGCLLGSLLHQFIINTSEPANMVFLTKIKYPSYIYSALFIYIFMMIVQVFTYFRLQKINMIESLKSVE